MRLKISGKKSETIDIDTLSKLDYIHAVIKETIRLYSPAPGTFPRIAKIDHYLREVKIRKGVRVRPIFLNNFYNSKNFADLDKFILERWINMKLDDPFIFIPFSAGNRNCIGQHLAILEAKVIICEFVDKFCYELEEGYKLRMGFKFLYEPAEKIYVTVKRNITSENA